MACTAEAVARSRPGNCHRRDSADEEGQYHKASAGGDGNRAAQLQMHRVDAIFMFFTGKHPFDEFRIQRLAFFDDSAQQIHGASRTIRPSGGGMRSVAEQRRQLRSDAGSSPAFSRISLLFR
jgi:hypothetical protein